jgi:ribosomal protein RSM22 (predicted rRNA methylase)
MIAALPETLLNAVEAELQAHDLTAIRTAADALSLAYRGQRNIARTLSPVERAAYLAVRFPSTFAAVGVVCDQLARIIDPASIRSVLDVGAGPGTASLAAARVLPHAKFHLFERDPGWRQTAERLCHAAGLDAGFRTAAIPTELAPQDAVIAAYALNELPQPEWAKAFAALWAAARHALILVEPGTPKGFAVIEAARAQALLAGAHAAAPCCHNDHCPMSTADWCHQPVRVARSSIHRAAKHGALPFEDEKFSYVILTRDPPRRDAPARIVRKPIRNAGHVHLDLCTAGTIQRVTIARSDKSLYRDARDADWGDAWPPGDQTGGD